MNENLEQKKVKNKKSKSSSLTVKLSILLAFFATVALVAYSFNRVSYAIPEEGVESTFPDTVQVVDVGSAAYANDYVIRVAGLPSVPFVLMRATVGEEEKYVYCIESDVDIVSNVTYNKDTKIDDDGLVYLTSYLLSDDYKIVDAAGNEVPEKVKAWIIQSAIWVYQSTVGATNNSRLTATDINTINMATTLYLGDNGLTPFYTSENPIYTSARVSGSDLPTTESTIRKILDKAITIHRTGDTWTLNTIKFDIKSDEITEGEDYYESDLITVSSVTKTLGYKFDLSVAPEGTYLVDENKNKIAEEALDNIKTETKFYLRVPKDKMPKESKVVLNVIGAYNTPLAYQYKANNVQTIVYIGNKVTHVNLSLNTDFSMNPRIIDTPEKIKTEDTAATTAQSFYFVGLIILLAGVGIIYANVKPKKEI